MQKNEIICNKHFIPKVKRCEKKINSKSVNTNKPIKYTCWIIRIHIKP